MAPRLPMPQKKQNWSQPLADLVGPVIDPVLAKQGFGESAIILHWDEIVGPRIASASEPLKLQWPPRGPKSAPDARAEPAILVIRVEGAFALELQHLAPIVVERINAHLGWRCVGRLAMRQGPLGKHAPGTRNKTPAGREALAQAAVISAGVGDDALRDALTRLGARVLADKAQPYAAASPSSAMPS